MAGPERSSTFLKNRTDTRVTSRFDWLQRPPLVEMEPSVRCVPLIVATGLLLVSPTRQTAVQQRLEPTDEARVIPELAKVRDAVLAAARRRDLEDIWRYTDSRVLATLSGKRGIPALKREWGIARSPGEFLRELVLVLSLGGKFEGVNRDAFVAPSVFADFPENLTGTHWIVIRADAPVYAAQSTNAAIVARSSFDIFPTRTLYRDRKEDWVQVTLHDGREAYMRTVDIRQAAESHARFEKRPNGWVLVGFYKGID
jgi:hypothetical protein